MISVKTPINDNEVKLVTIEYMDITIEELLRELKIDKQHIGSVLVNGVPKKFSDKYEDNSEIYFLPILSGG